ncbi:hypothetical protein L1987_34379 [Smallanthus sonchifolius]|uniref:Uncharacterized protein n=1 Tax=Smallanthus sonchifolius TaxID=185202 RepID=A0ACB9HT40_9ASTR|nr:hypothetical protein L1987_34379 [Smallanthus sonchifolius]
MANSRCATSETHLVKSVCAIVLKGCSWDTLLKHRIGSIITSTTVSQILHNFSQSGSSSFISWNFFKWVELNPNYKHSLQSSWTMIRILTKQRHFKSAHQLLDKIALRDFLSSSTVLNALATNCNDQDVNSHVLSWLVIFYANSKMTHDAIQVFEHMRVHGLKPHLPACTVLLNSLVKERLTDTMWKLYKKMVKIEVVPNLHIYNVLIHACCKSLDVEKAEELLGEMEIKCVSPDLFTYNTLILLYCKKGMHYEALCIQDRMDKSEGRIKDANKLLNEMSGRKVVPDNITCNTLINAYCKIGDMKSALKVRGDSVVFTSLAYAYLKAGDTSTGLKIFDEMYKKSSQSAEQQTAQAKAQAQEKGSQLMDQASNAAQSAQDSMQQAGQQVKEKAQEATEAVKNATGMNS